MHNWRTQTRRRNAPEQKASLDQLTAEEIGGLEKVLLSSASDEFRRIARIVGAVMMSPLHKHGIPDLFYAERVRHLVATSQLESQDNLASMRSSEVRLVDRIG